MQEVKELWVVLDEDGLPAFCAPFPEMCHDHINNAIIYHDITEAALWKVRRATIDTPLAHPEMRHTKGPWVAVKPEGAPYYGIHAPESSEKTVAGTASGLSKDDAEFIVKACNAYEARPLYRHADGGLYELLGTADGAGPQAGLLPFAVYAGADGRLWYREPWSFNQRFTKEGAQ